MSEFTGLYPYSSFHIVSVCLIENINSSEIEICQRVGQNDTHKSRGYLTF